MGTVKANSVEARGKDLETRLARLLGEKHTGRIACATDCYHGLLLGGAGLECSDTFFC